MRTPYVHNPNLYRDHFRSQIGSALPGFRGMPVHRGHGLGAVLGKLARKAIPLLISGAKLAKPHLTKAAKGIAHELTGQVVSKLSQKTNKRKRKMPTRVRRKKQSKRATSDIFDNVIHS